MTKKKSKAARRCPARGTGRLRCRSTVPTAAVGPEATGGGGGSAAILPPTPDWPGQGGASVEAEAEATAGDSRWGTVGAAVASAASAASVTAPWSSVSPSACHCALPFLTASSLRRPPRFLLFLSKRGGRAAFVTHPLRFLARTRSRQRWKGLRGPPVQCSLAGSLRPREQ